MFNPIKTLFFSHQQAAPADEQPERPADTIVRENFTWDTDAMSVSEVIAKLREQTVNFSFQNLTTWAITDLDFRGVEIRCKLTKAQDIVWAVNGERIASQSQVIAFVSELAITF